VTLEKICTTLPLFGKNNTVLLFEKHSKDMSLHKSHYKQKHASTRILIVSLLLLLTLFSSQGTAHLDAVIGKVRLATGEGYSPFFSTPINFVPVHMYVASDAIFTSPEQLMNKRLCFPFSYSLDSLEQGIVDKFQMKINRVKDGIGCVKHVQKGWSDAGLTNGYIRANKLPKNEGDDISIVIFPEQLALIPLYLVIGKDYPNAKNGWQNLIMLTHSCN
jgi:hypothetical protein